MPDMYADIILDHYRNPRNAGRIDNATIKQRDTNPLCGDEAEMFLLIKDNHIEDVKFQGHGCAISQASISMLTEEVKGKSLDDVKKMDKDDILRMLGIQVSAPRMKCALLGLKILKLAVYTYLGQKIEEDL